MTPDELIKEQQRKEELKLRKRNKQFKIIVIIMMIVSYGLSGFMGFYIFKDKKQVYIPNTNNIEQKIDNQEIKPTEKQSNIDNQEIKPTEKQSNIDNQDILSLYSKIENLENTINALQISVANSGKNENLVEQRKRDRETIINEFLSTPERPKDLSKITEPDFQKLLDYISEVRIDYDKQIYSVALDKEQDINSGEIKISFFDGSGEFAGSGRLSLDQFFSYHGELYIRDYSIEREIVNSFTYSLYRKSIPEDLLTDKKIKTSGNLVMHNKKGYIIWNLQENPDKTFEDFYEFSVEKQLIYVKFIEE